MSEAEKEQEYNPWTKKGTLAWNIRKNKEQFKDNERIYNKQGWGK